MEGILSILKKTCAFKCLPCNKINLDYHIFEEYQDIDERPAEIPFERPQLDSQKKVVPTYNSSGIFKYFLDGSRKTYKVFDVVVDKKKFLPVVAGQIGVALMERQSTNNRVKPLRRYCKFKNVIAFPDSLGSSNLDEIQNVINKSSRCKLEVIKYQASKINTAKDPIDLAVAKIMEGMQRLELQIVKELVDDELLDPYSMLVIDGPLRFQGQHNPQQFKNVIGISKTFRPTFQLGKRTKKIDVGSLTFHLKFGERTTVFKMLERKNTIGMWYLRIRPMNIASNPLQGIVKIERCAVDSVDKEEGFTTARIDTISSLILNERSVSVPLRDKRWASHLYPIYMAERYIKSSFKSDLEFQAIF